MVNGQRIRRGGGWPPALFAQSSGSSGYGLVRPCLIDSNGAKSLVTREGTTRSKPISISYHYIREAAGLGAISISVPSLENAADGFMKIHGFGRSLNI
jgi:hypothetical protein